MMQTATDCITAYVRGIGQKRIPALMSKPTIKYTITLYSTDWTRL